MLLSSEPAEPLRAALCLAEQTLTVPRLEREREPGCRWDGRRESVSVSVSVSVVSVPGGQLSR